MKLRRLVRLWGNGRWNGWPQRAYANEHYQQRLQAVQQHLTECLDLAAPGHVRIISMCAGDGRDVMGVLESHARRHDVAAWLIELSRESVVSGTRLLQRAGLENSVRFLNADATNYANYGNIAPADIVLVCGVWGHVPPDQRALLIRGLGSLCKPGGAVIWTRGAQRVGDIESLFSRRSWEKVRITLTTDRKWSVATHCYRGPASSLPSAGRIFSFKRCAG